MTDEMMNLRALVEKLPDGHGHGRYLQEPGEPAVRRHRPAGEGFPRPADRGRLPYLWIDATYLKVRQAGRSVSVAVIVAVGANSDAGHGYRTV